MVIIDTGTLPMVMNQGADWNFVNKVPSWLRPGAFTLWLGSFRGARAALRFLNLTKSWQNSVSFSRTRRECTRGWRVSSRGWRAGSLEQLARHERHGLPAYSHHDRFPPWWGFVRDDNGGNLSGDKIPPLTMIMINHYLTQFNSSHWWWLLIIWLSSTRLNYTMLCYKKEL